MALNKERLKEYQRKYQKKRRQAIKADPERYEVEKAKKREWYRNLPFEKKAAYSRKYIERYHRLKQLKQNGRTKEVTDRREA